MEIRNSVGFLFEPFKNLKIDVRLLREKEFIRSNTCSEELSREIVYLMIDL